MRYTYWFHLRDSNGVQFPVSSHCVSKTRLHKAIDYYSKNFFIEQIVVQPYGIQNPCPVGDKTDIKIEGELCC